MTKGDLRRNQVAVHHTCSGYGVVAVHGSHAGVFPRSTRMPAGFHRARGRREAPVGYSERSPLDAHVRADTRKNSYRAP